MNERATKQFTAEDEKSTQIAIFPTSTPDIYNRTCYSFAFICHYHNFNFSLFAYLTDLVVRFSGRSQLAFHLGARMQVFYIWFHCLRLTLFLRFSIWQIIDE